MSVLQLRRDMVVVEEGQAVEPAADIETPFPLRTIEPDTIEGELTEIHGPEPLQEGAGRSLFRTVRLWLNGFAVAAVLSAYPVMTVLASDVGDASVAGLVDRTKWTAPWVGGAATLMERHFNDLGWASDAPAWAPMARLTAKPAYQSAMAGAIGEFLALADSQASARGASDADLSAAARLVSENATGMQLRAARDALLSHDRRLRRRATSLIATRAQLDEQLALLDAWGLTSQTEIAASASMLGGSPFDEAATVAVYAAKGRAIAAYVFLDTMHWPENAEATDARNAALKAWKDAAQFHPMIVLNGSPDGSIFGNHAASMGFLIGQAQKATAAYRMHVAPPVSARAPAPAMADAAPSAAVQR